LAESTVAEQAPSTEEAPAAEEVEAVGEAAAAVAAAGSTEPHQAQQPVDGETAGRVKASPLARRLAAEGGVELSGVQGSGPGGRIVKRDVEAALESGPAAAEAPAAAPAATAAAEYRDIPLSQMRKTIARRLTQSIGPVPHF